MSEYAVRDSRGESLGHSAPRTLDPLGQLLTVEQYIEAGGSAWPLVWDTVKANYARIGIELDWNKVEAAIKVRLARRPASSLSRQ